MYETLFQQKCFDIWFKPTLAKSWLRAWPWIVMKSRDDDFDVQTEGLNQMLAQKMHF